MPEKMISHPTTNASLLPNAFETYSNSAPARGYIDESSA